MFAVNIDITGEARAILEDLAKDRGLWGDMVVGAYQDSVDRMFKTGGFGKWTPLKETTVRYRAHRSRGHYKRVAPEAGSGPSYPMNTWSGRLRESIAGRQQRSLTPRKLRGGRENFKIRTRLRYAAAALSLRPIDGAVIDQLVAMMESKIHQGLSVNIQTRLSR